VLGPEPWKVAYVEPSVRPDDGRYGENPNRLGTHYQFQVILKPDPGDPQELYLRSLEAIGIDPAKHDIRFVEDNWQSPALGAWGLGWEVWLDGLEITQFTYFQQAGGMELDPVSVEITYGIDRIAAPLQGVSGFQNIRWNQQRTFGDLNLKAEQEHSQYYFEIADVERARQMYELYEAETEAALKAGLALPAYDYVIKSSHTFNILDTRGAIGVTERQAYFRRMRALASKVAELYLEQRQHEEFPWLDAAGANGDGDAKATKTKKTIELKSPTKAADLLLEIGTEELPAGDLEAAMQQVEEQVPALLDKLRLEHGNVAVFGTPRRLAVQVENLASAQPDREEIAKGPPAERAFDAAGGPTKAAEGFAQGKGVSVSDLEVQEIDGGRYVVAKVKEKGRSAVEVLAEALPELISNLRFERSMRWNASNETFSRPVRWLLALHGEHVAPFEFAGLGSGNTSRGLRFSDPTEFEIKDASDYFKQLEKQGIIPDPDARREEIKKQVETLAKEVGGQIPDDPGLLSEVTNLVEAPVALRGSFEESYLGLPREVLIAVMKKHQRYFPVEKDGELLPYFITVANGKSKEPQVVAGNENVIRARFADADFFIREDRKKKLPDYVPILGTLTFQKDLGSMLDKTKRIEALAGKLAKQLDLSKEELNTAKRAAHLSKADLVTDMVVEMTSLQGVMGKYYALESGESAEVAEAIEDQYQPTAAKTKPGLVIGLADRLDSLVGLFAAGMQPSGNKDPFGLRRAALGLIQNLISWNVGFDVKAALEQAAKLQPVKVSEESLDNCFSFIVERERNLFLEAGRRYDVVEAVLGAQGGNPAGAKQAIAQLGNWVAHKDWQKTLDAYARCVRITRDQKKRYEVDTKLFSEAAEKELYKALEKAEAKQPFDGSVDDFLTAFTPMIPAIDRFFEDVLVMADDQKQKENRLGLLQRIAALAEGVADLSQLEGF
jgi:glycyl-tRNA synthetase